MVRQEIYGYLLTHYAIAALICGAATEADIDPDPLLAKEVAATSGPAATQVKSNAGCPVSARESPYVTLVTGTRRGSWCTDHVGGRRHCPESCRAAGGHSASRTGNCSNVPGAK
jgi:hypothetical protein